MVKKWIQQAKLKKGALTDYCKNNRSRLRKKYGEDPFTKHGTIRASTLRKMAKDKHLSLKTRKRANLALSLRKMKKK